MPGAILSGLLNDLRHVGGVDLVVVSGDIADDGSEQGCADALALVADFALPRGAAQVWCLGNHDNREAFTAVFGSGHFDASAGDVGLGAPREIAVCAAVSEVEGLRVITLDSLVPGQVHGQLDGYQIDWLRHTLRVPAAQGTVLVLHQPPISTTPQWEAANLQQPDVLAEALTSTDVRAVLCGHVHAQIGGALAGVPVWVTPGVLSRVDLTAPPGVVRAVRGAAASVVNFSASGAVQFHTVLARDPRAGEQISLADGTSWQYLDQECAPLA